MTNSKQANGESSKETIEISIQPWKNYMQYFLYRSRRLLATLIISAIGSKYTNTIIDILLFFPNKLNDVIENIMALNITTKIMLTFALAVMFIAVRGWKQMQRVQSSVNKIEERVDDLERDDSNHD